MKVSCDIIRDILPLYAEDMVSNATRDMVDEHLCECDSCTKELGVLKKAERVPVEVDTQALKKVKKAIGYRRILAVVTALLLALTVYCGGGLLLDAKIYLTAEQAVESVEAGDDGSIRIRWKDCVNMVGTIGSGTLESAEDTMNYGVIARSTLAQLLFPREKKAYEEMPEEVKSVMTEDEYYNSASTSTIQLEGGASSWNIWYCRAKDGRAETLLWDAGNPHPDEAFKNVNYHLAYYCGVLAVLMVAMKVFANLWRGKLAGKIASILDALFSCVLISTLLVSGFQFVEVYGEFTESLVEGILVSIPMFATTLCTMLLRDLNLRDKAV